MALEGTLQSLVWLETNIDRIQVPISQRPWPRTKRFASVNNFGFGGTNAHVVLEKAPVCRKSEQQVDSGVKSRKLFLLSANNKISLEALMKNLGIYLEQRPEIFQNDLMTNVAYTLGERRSSMQWRYVLIFIRSSSPFKCSNCWN
jgi:acyl transferase domain-containing protein